MPNDKNHYLELQRELLTAEPASLPETLPRYLTRDCRWQAAHPVNGMAGPAEVVSRLWRPLRAAFPRLERSNDILMGGEYEGRTWVSATGYYRGRFEMDWLGIPATGKETTLRFGEFVRFHDGRLAEAYTLFDLVAFCRQCGIDLLPADRGSMDPVPPPDPRDGVMHRPQEPEQGRRSLQLVQDMIDGLLEYDGSNLGSMGMERFWTDDMRWYGPGGIGTTHRLAGFQAQHQGPFLKAFPDRIAAPHAALVAEGHYVSVTGWPSVIGTHLGDYLLAPASGRKVGMRVMDFWRRHGDRLAENWVLIDMLDLFRQLDIDLLENAINND
jgi:predicted ester cyclase